MKKLIASIALVLLTLPSIFAQNSLLWKIEGKGIQTSYLFGTFHIFPQDKFRIPAKVRTALESCDQMVMELAMKEGIELKMIQMAAMKDGKTLDDLMVTDDLILLDSAFGANGMSRMFFNTWKPFLITSVFYNQYMDGGVASFELALQKLAIERDMAILGLETVERQMTVFDAIPYEDQAKDLIEIIKEKKKYKDLFDKMVATYLAEDVEALLKMSEAEMNNLEELDLLLTTRNEEWIPKMNEMMTSKSTFFGVGAGHLGGTNGLISLLKKQGYKVKPVFD